MDPTIQLQQVATLTSSVIRSLEDRDREVTAGFRHAIGPINMSEAHP